VPHDTALTTSARALLFDLGQKLLDTEGLLIAGRDLPCFLIEQNEEADEFQKPLWRQEADNQPVLIRRQLMSSPKALEVVAHFRWAIGEDCGLHTIGDRPVLDLGKMGLWKLLFAPARPEFLWCFRRAVPAVGATYAQ